MSAPYDLSLTVKSLEAPGNEVYNLVMTEGMQSNVLNNYDLLIKHEKEIGYDLHKCLKVKRIAEFDQLFCAPVNGYKTSADFYKYLSCTNVVQNIKTPTLLLHSLDDPVCIPEGIPFQKIKDNPNIMLVLT